ncbi:MAG TPA: 6-bladed beta-propeller [Gemmatimonadaceae bacterium]
MVSVSPEWRESAGWTIDPTPAVEIGVDDGEEPYMFSRVFDALRLPDGRILVGNSSTSEIRVFDREGKFLKSVGRKGNGPGEFGELSAVRFWRLSDGSFLGYDNGNLRVHFYDSSFAYQRTVRIESTRDGLRAFLQGVFADGSWQMLALVPELRNEPGTYLRSAQQFVRFHPDGTPDTTLRRVEGRTRFVHQFGSITHFPFVPFTAEPLAAAGQHLWVVSGGGSEVEQRNLQGDLLRITRLLRDIPRTADVYPRYVESSLATMDSARRAQYEHFYGLNHPLPEHIPAYQAMLLDATSHVWLERYRLPGDTMPRWDVIAPNGRWLGTVSVPSRLRVMQVGADYVLGRHLDSLGVERIRVHALRSGPK